MYLHDSTTAGPIVDAYYTGRNYADQNLMLVIEVLEPGIAVELSRLWRGDIVGASTETLPPAASIVYSLPSPVNRNCDCPVIVFATHLLDLRVFPSL